SPLSTLPLTHTPHFPYTTLFRSNFSTISPTPGILANFCAVNTKKKIKIKKTNRVINNLVTLNVTKYGTNKPILSAPQLAIVTIRSEEHTSELQSRFDLVCRLLLE